jgi:S1-C subfamily serine protease
VLREVFSLRSTVRPGNSGGPLVSLDGKVTGVVFAASVTDRSTGYALTAGQVAQAAARAVTSDAPVDTGGCA